MKSMKGFTLIELLITMVIAAVLGMIAIPTYGKYVITSRRSSAQEELIRLTNQMENCYSMNQTYQGCLGTGDNASALSNSIKSELREFYEGASDTNITTSNYRLVLRAKNAQTGDTGCTVLGIDRNGIRFSGSGTSNSDTNHCWQ